MNLTPNYYKNRVALNVLAGSVDNAKDIYEAGRPCGGRRFDQELRNR